MICPHQPGMGEDRCQSPQRGRESLPSSLLSIDDKDPGQFISSISLLVLLPSARLRGNFITPGLSLKTPGKKSSPIHPPDPRN